MSNYVFASDTASVRVRGYPVTVKRGTVWHRDDPTVKAFPSLFTDTPTVLTTYPGWVPPDEVVEQLTAAPGERRTTKRAR